MSEQTYLVSSVSAPSGLIEDITDLSSRLPVLERVVLGMIMFGYNQVEIAQLLNVRKNTVSTIKIRARKEVLTKYA